MAPRLLLDANLSPETAEYLRSLGFRVISLLEEKQGGLKDRDVALMAENKNLTIITFDLDFGEIYYFAKQKKFGVIVLRLEDQRIEKVNEVLENFFANYTHLLTKKPLVILTETSTRIS